MPETERRTTAMAVRLIALVALHASVVVTTLDISLTSTSLPTIARSLDVGAASSIWIVNAYYLAVVASLLPMAALGEIHGHERVFMTGLLVFACGAVACALAGSLPALALSRAVLGLGSAAVSATTPALIKALYPPDKLGRGLGVYALVVGITISLGPVIASTVLAFASWRWLYAMNVPVALAAFLLARRELPATERSPRVFDWLSAGLTALTLAAALFALTGIAHRAAGAAIAVAAATAGLAGYALRRRERDSARPILAVDLFRVPLFALSSATSICAFAVQGLIFVVLPFLFQHRLGYSQVESGFLITPWPVTLALMSLVAAPLADRIAPGFLAGSGLLVILAGLVSLALMPSTAGIFDISWRLVVCGVGFGFFQSPNMKAIMSSAPAARSGAAGGILAASRLVGQSLGAAAVAISLAQAPEHGFETAMWVGVAIAVVGSVVSYLRLLPGIRHG